MNPLIAWALGAVVMVIALGLASVRVVAAGTCGVVTRFGRVTRVVTPGPVRVTPLVDRLIRVTVGPHRADPIVVAAVTRDGFSVRLTASALWQVHDARAFVTVHAGAPLAVADAVERCLQRLTARRDLIALLAGREQMLEEAEAVLAPVAAGWGVTVLDVSLSDVDLRAAPELLRLLR